MTTGRTSSENVTSRFYDHFSIVPNHLACEICTVLEFNGYEWVKYEKKIIIGFLIARKCGCGHPYGDGHVTAKA